MQVQTIAIIGINRLTVSAGLAIKERLPSLTVIGCDPLGRTELMKEVKEMGAIDEIVIRTRAAGRRGDVILLGNRLDQTEETLAEIGSDVQEHAIITDFGPFKKPVQAWADKHLTRGFYVGAMPIVSVDSPAGGNDQISTASAELFANSLMCLMPSAAVDQGAVDTITSIGSVLGCKPFFVSDDEFDIYAHALETMPSLVSLAMFKGLRAQTGWGDLERLAGLTFLNMAAQVGRGSELAHLIEQDKKSTLHWLNLILQHLEEVRDWVRDSDRATLEQVFDEIAEDRNVWLLHRRDNAWTSVDDTKPTTLNDMLFGGFVNRFRKRD